MEKIRLTWCSLEDRWYAVSLETHGINTASSWRNQMRIRLEDGHDIVEGLERMRPDQKIAISALKRPISHAAYALAAINIIAKYGVPCIF